MPDADVLVAGGGPAGLCAAAALGQEGLSVLLAAPDPPAPGGKPRPDPRTTALLLPACAFLRELGLWEALAPAATPLARLRVADAAGDPPRIVGERLFDPRDIGADRFGWNVPNETLRRALLAHLQEAPGVTLRSGAAVASMVARTGEVRARLSDGERVRCRLVVAADGRGSPAREAAGIGVGTTRYGQKALAFAATHALPHGCVSSEIYRSGGAFTTVPLPDHGGRPASSVVWMEEGRRADELAGMPQDAFNAEMTARACGVLGPMARMAAPAAFPVVTQRARRLTAERCVVMAEAAHVLPPIAAQGLNTSLRDVETLWRLVRGMPPGALGSRTQLDRYERARAGDTLLRARAVDLFNRLCKSGDPAVRSLRAAGLRAAFDAAPVRRALMRFGMGSPYRTLSSTPSSRATDASTS